ncbi:MAG TPA: prepilin-type N-terminal cleavage/methylation domain-containing protein [Candidatus Omnitrophota bacterium]|nr:prepilin-type N-terminal cleavage/methylation domain-containing protein [Candidatus Omnitrophota bacterium]HQL41530.1 prepilin-type N-terminal cleavage/methylation domain-containing protein [Candidatus Omnitrophota bacterium]
MIKKGFTLIEVIIVIIIIAVLAAVSIPKYTGAVERSKAAEGTYILGTLLSAQERYFLENSAFATALADLDVTIPTPKYFAMPTVSSSCSDASACATIVRSGSLFTLTIVRNGTISCSGSGCTLAGF